MLELPEVAVERRLGSEWRHHGVLIVKEAVNNAVKHSGGTEVRLRIVILPDGLELGVSDNGRGITPNVEQGPGNGLGNLRSRADALCGRLAIEGLAGGGTRVSAFLPWPPESESKGGTS